MVKRFCLAPWMVAILLLVPGVCLGQSKSGAAKAKQPQPGDEITIPAGTEVPLNLTAAISSRTAYVGEPIYCQTIYPVDIHDRIVIPVGTYIGGTITEVDRAGHIHRRAALGLRFDSMILPNGVSKFFSGMLAGFAGNGREGFKKTESRIEGAGDKGRSAERVLITSAEGAGVGAIASHSGAGAAAGGIGGAIVGTVFVLASRGKDIVLPAGTSLQLEFTRPLVFYRYQLGSPVMDPSGPAFPKRDPGPGM